MGRNFGDAFLLTLVTNDLSLAGAADKAGVDRIGIDLETLGKEERQAGCGMRLSRHNWDDLIRISPSVHRAESFVRINPIHSLSETEIETALELGARALMLPGVRTAAEAATFVRIIRGRARAIVMVEFAPAAVRIRDLLAVRGIDEVMIGLNDLHLQLGAANGFELLASPLIDMLAAEVRRKGLPLAIGGVGRADDDSLPIPPDLVFAQYPRLDATGAWISRSFVNGSPVDAFPAAVVALRRRLDHWAAASPEDLEAARVELARHAATWLPASRASAQATA